MILHVSVCKGEGGIGDVYSIARTINGRAGYSGFSLLMLVCR